MRKEITGESCFGEYLNDGRRTIAELYWEYDRLLDFGFEKDLIYTQYILDESMNGGSRSFPIFCYRSKRTNLGSLWLISGTHGEEPAGPEAIAAEIETLGRLGKTIPIVIIPLCNPSGRFRDWRYENEYRDDSKGTSMTDAEHWLLQTGQPLPRREKAVCIGAEAITKYVLEGCFVFPPIVAIDFHEDTGLPESYVYSQSLSGENDPGAKLMVELMRQSGMEIQMEGETNVGEKVHNGIISAVNDGSITELMTAPRVFYKGQILDKPFARSAYVVETPVYGVALPKRVETHRRIIRSLEEIWKLA